MIALASSRVTPSIFREPGVGGQHGGAGAGVRGRLARGVHAPGGGDGRQGGVDLVLDGADGAAQAVDLVQVGADQQGVVGADHHPVQGRLQLAPAGPQRPQGQGGQGLRVTLAVGQGVQDVGGRS